MKILYAECYNFKSNKPKVPVYYKCFPYRESETKVSKSTSNIISACLQVFYCQFLLLKTRPTSYLNYTNQKVEDLRYMSDNKKTFC